VRRPRVQLTYDVQVGDAMQLRELPFVVGVLGDYSGKPDKPLPPLKERRFVEIDRDNFDQVLEGMSPRLTFRVDDKLSGKPDSQLSVELRFASMDDFSPEAVARQIEPMRQLLEKREHLKSLLARMDGNDRLEELLEEVLKQEQARSQLGGELGVSGETDTEQS
jgi:type VI secretion system protein ImpB